MVRNYLIYLLLLSMLMSSCSVGEFDNINTETETFEPEVVYVNDIMTKARSVPTQNGVVVECISISFPFSMVDVDGTNYEVNQSSDFNHLVSDSTIIIVDFVYPLQIIDNIGLTITVADLWEFASYAAGCYPDSHSTDMFPAYLINYQNSCYSIRYPVTVQNMEGVTYIIPDERTFIQKHAAEPLYFVFPLTVTDVQNQDFIANHPTALAQLLLECNGFGWTDTTYIQFDQFATFACYVYEFPIYAIVHGLTAPLYIPDAATLGSIMMQGRFSDYVYPLNLKTFDGQIVTANNQQELFDLADECIVNGDFIILLISTKMFADTPCYDLVFPFSVSRIGGTNVTINSYSNIENLIMQDTLFAAYSTNYPVSIVLGENNQTKVLDSIDDVIETINECN